MTDTISCLVYTEPPIARVALVKIVRRLSPFLQYNLDLIYFASPLPSLFFGPGGGGEFGIFTDRDQRSIFWVLNFENLYFFGYWSQLLYFWVVK